MKQWKSIIQRFACHALFKNVIGLFLKLTISFTIHTNTDIPKWGGGGGGGCLFGIYFFKQIPLGSTVPSAASV